MPSDKSHRVSVNKAAQNKIVRSAARTAQKKGLLAAQEASPSAAADVKTAIAAMDRAARKGIVHRNKAARAKSQLMRALNAGQSKSA
ncbi:MAG: 30S ribosomal protein S20 [Dehalococcoidia bacterium]|nr:30S ribosomal protein S20 [Dehalococcoidia bacterium]